MRFGLNFFPSFRVSDMSTADYYQQVLGLACARCASSGLGGGSAVEPWSRGPN